MDDPRNEIVDCVKKLTTSPTPASQAAAVNRYFDPEAGFQHPLCTVLPGPGSREKILGVYQWYRDMSPHIDLEVESFIYDEQQTVAYLNVVQKFHIFLSPFKPAPARLLVKVTLSKNDEDGRYYIFQQEDFYQPEDLFYLILPFLAPAVSFAKRLAGVTCGVNAAVFAVGRDSMRYGMALVGLGPRQKNGRRLNARVRSD